MYNRNINGHQTIHDNTILILLSSHSGLYKSQSNWLKALPLVTVALI